MTASGHSQPVRRSRGRRVERGACRRRAAAAAAGPGGLLRALDLPRSSSSTSTVLGEGFASSASACTAAGRGDSAGRGGRARVLDDLRCFDGLDLVGRLGLVDGPGLVDDRRLVGGLGLVDDRRLVGRRGLAVDRRARRRRGLVDDRGVVVGRAAGLVDGRGLVSDGGAVDRRRSTSRRASRRPGRRSSCRRRDPGRGRDLLTFGQGRGVVVSGGRHAGHRRGGDCAAGGVREVAG